MYFLIFAQTTLLVLLSLFLQNARADRITAAALTDWPPYSDQSLPNRGFDNELLVEAMKISGHQVEIHMLPWPRAITDTAAGKYDILPSAWFSEERSKDFIFSHAFIINKLIFVKVPGSDFEFHDLQDLKGKRIGILFEYAYPLDFLKSKQFKKYPVANEVQNIRKLIMGRIDLALDDQIALNYLIHTRFPEYNKKIVISRNEYAENKLFMAFPKKNPHSAQLLKDFNSGLEQMKADGSFEALLKKHQMH